MEKINFIPPAEVMNEWEVDYKAMQIDMIYGESKPFKKNYREINIVTGTLP